MLTPNKHIKWQQWLNCLISKALTPQSSMQRRQRFHSLNKETSQVFWLFKDAIYKARISKRKFFNYLARMCLIHLKMKEIEKGVKISLSCCFIFFSYLKHSCRQEIQMIIPRWNDFCDVRFRGLNNKKRKTNCNICCINLFYFLSATCSFKRPILSMYFLLHSPKRISRFHQEN